MHFELGKDHRLALECLEENYELRTDDGLLIVSMWPSMPEPCGLSLVDELSIGLLCTVYGKASMFSRS